LEGCRISWRFQISLKNIEKITPHVQLGRLLTNGKKLSIFLFEAYKKKS